VDFFQYRQPWIKLEYVIDAREINVGMIHRSNKDQNIHIDQGFGDAKIRGEMLNELRNDVRKTIYRGEYIPAIGVARAYAFVICKAGKQPVKCSTVFRIGEGNLVSFENGEIFEWLAEEHESPPVPIDCFRVFFRALATPLKSRPFNL